MKTTKTFENATLRTVNNGYIELDYNGKTDCFHNASVISVNNGIITIEVDWKPKEGELIKLTGRGTNCYCIYRQCEPNRIYDYGYKKIANSTLCTVIDNISWCTAGVIISPVTPEEQKEFDDFCKSQGKIWNREKLQWENYRWKPMYGDKYYCVNLASLSFVVCHTWAGDTIDYDYYNQNNCFKTKEEAEAKLEQIKKLLLEV